MPLIADNAVKLAAALTVVALIIAGLVLGKIILFPFALAIVLSFMLSPIVRWLNGLGLPRSLAVGLTVAAVVMTALSATGVFSAQLLSLAADLSAYRTNVTAKVRSVTGGSTDNLISRALKSVEALESAIRSELGTPRPSADQQQPAVDPQTRVEPSAVVERSSFVLEILAYLGLTFLFTLLMLIGQQDIRDRLVRVLGTDNMTGTTSALSEAGYRLSRYFLLIGLLNLAFGAFVAVALFIIGVPNPLLWGVATAVLRFVPFIGSFLSAIPPIFLAAAVDPGWSMVIATLAVFLIGEPLMGHVIEPLVIGKGIGLQPIAVVVAAAFWTLVWGPGGLVLASPLTMALVLLGQYVPRLAFLDVLLGDAPPLTPEQQFYHRLLAADSVAAGNQIAEVAEEASPVRAIDTVVLPALRLAARDFSAGRLLRHEVPEVAETLSEATAFLQSEGVEEERSCDGLCVVIPGQGPVDALSSTAVAAVLDLASTCTCVAVDKASGLLALATVKASDQLRHADTLVISTVGGIELSHLRHVVKRARQDFPSMRIVVGSWGRDSLSLEDLGDAGDDMLLVTKLGDAFPVLSSRARTKDATKAPDESPAIHPVPATVAS